MTEDGPLAGIRILDLSMVLAGPFCTQILGDLGAEVIKVEPLGGDPARSFGPYFDRGHSVYFLAINRNKKSIALNLKDHAARLAFEGLVSKCDVVFDSFRPGVMERLGLDNSRLSKINQRLVTCSISGFGQYGPLSERPAFDIIVQAMGGAMSLTGEPGRTPVIMGLPVGDCLAGMFAAHGVMAALLRRDRTGEGGSVDISMLDSQVALLSVYAAYFFASGAAPPPLGTRHPQNVPAQVFAAKDGYIAVYATLDSMFLRLAASLGRSTLADDERFASAEQRRRHRAELERILSDIFREDTVLQWERTLSANDVPVAPVQDLAQALSQPQIVEREMVTDIPHPAGGSYQALGNPVRITGKQRPPIAPPKLGEHTHQLLRDLAGLDPGAIAALAEAGSILVPIAT